jgi:hypothetical protein
MNRLASVITGLLLVLAAASAPAVSSAASASTGRWSIGADLELTFVNPEVGSNSTVFAWPGDGNAPAYQPGMRIGYEFAGKPSEVYVNTGLDLVTGDGSSLTTFELTGNYQYNFHGSKPKTSTPYLTGGLGLVSASYNVGTGFGSLDVGATSLIYGFGVGMRHRVADGHGSIRTEARFDHLTEGDDGGVVVIESSNLIGLKVGFDLWLD